jgi:hypothetical protein
LKHFKKNIEKSWDWKYLSQNNNITWEIVQQYSEKPWDWKQLSMNEFILSR